MFVLFGIEIENEINYYFKTEKKKHKLMDPYNKEC